MRAVILKRRYVSLNSLESTLLSNCLFRMKRTIASRDKIKMTKAMFLTLPGSRVMKRLRLRDLPFLSAISIIPVTKRVGKTGLAISASEAELSSKAASLLFLL